MRITGKNLDLVYNALTGAIDNMKYHIGGCPDVVEYEEEIAMCQTSIDEFSALRKRVKKSMEKEGWLFSPEEDA